MAVQYEQCRYLRRSGEQCTAEAVDPDNEMVLCAKHLARANRAYHDAVTSMGRRRPTADTA